jgi:hypothetical protein
MNTPNLYLLLLAFSLLLALNAQPVLAISPQPSIFHTSGSVALCSQHDPGHGGCNQPGKPIRTAARHNGQRTQCSG